MAEDPRVQKMRQTFAPADAGAADAETVAESRARTQRVLELYRRGELGARTAEEAVRRRSRGFTSG